MDRQRRESDQYLRQYPELNRWLNVCVTCGARGYKPELPDNIDPRPNVAAHHLRRYFTPLPLNDLGQCQQCEVGSALD
jgi:hypothetical protein